MWNLDSFLQQTKIMVYVNKISSNWFSKIWDKNYLSNGNNETLKFIFAILGHNVNINMYIILQTWRWYWCGLFTPESPTSTVPDSFEIHTIYSWTGVKAIKTGLTILYEQCYSCLYIYEHIKFSWRMASFYVRNS